ncbi:vitamin K epoxide reductase family protein [Flavobacterium sp. NRK F7]|uniref:vitamin K epoxide reductase family protein n=1 Tax=Flavobacterium sp. NRK F7 TaxID=2954930 RepID=UPI002091501D|nr:vitamin K epoxide reductase family protein [Flavobacterium sp. NRK F7]MCO6161377.1 vitamin K epoxide reductase family protein [Flavobacterium sp. NRK F7]
MISIVKKILQINHYKEQQYSFENLFLSHPNYPSLYAVTDTLDMLQIENVAAQVPKEQFSALPDSFLAVVSNDIVLVRRLAQEVSIETEKEGKKKVSFEAFLEQWTGVVVAIEPNEITQKERLPLMNTTYVGLGVLLLVLLGLTFREFTLPFLLTFLCSSIGLFLSVVIIDEKINKSEGVISKICSFNAHTSCDSVIKSESSRLTKWLDFSDLPILFFGTSILLLQLAPASYAIVNFLSLLSLPMVGYSIWLQKAKLGKWCVLCLGVSMLLVLESLLFVGFTKDFSFYYLGLIQASVVVFSVWFFIKPILNRKVTLEKENVTLLKFKRNFSIFSSLQKPVLEVEVLHSIPTIILGNKEASVRIDLILSPSCGHCHTAFSQAIDLLQQFSDRLQVGIYYNLNTDNLDNPYLIVAKTILQLHKEHPQMAEAALMDWHIEGMSLKDWKAKWTIGIIDFEVEENLRSEYTWCMKNEFNYTPVKLVNGSLYPDEYELQELKYFISELAEKEEAVLV